MFRYLQLFLCREGVGWRMWRLRRHESDGAAGVRCCMRGLCWQRPLWSPPQHSRNNLQTFCTARPLSARPGGLATFLQLVTAAEDIAPSLPLFFWRPCRGLFCGSFSGLAKLPNCKSQSIQQFVWKTSEQRKRSCLMLLTLLLKF